MRNNLAPDGVLPYPAVSDCNITMLAILAEKLGPHRIQGARNNHQRSEVIMRHVMQVIPVPGPSQQQSPSPAV